MSETGYRLIDFGDGRKLESFAGRVFDRPSPAAEGVQKHSPSRWKSADSVFQETSRRWQHRTAVPDAMTVELDGFCMPISPTPFGHVGLFPEQALNWRWLMDTAPVAVAPPASGLNLFGYTGASSIAMAIGGMKVAHVDAAKPNVATARLAAGCNGLTDHPIRYLVDDAVKFTARELRRGNRYQTIVMDPPAYGHGPSGKAWRLERDLWPLIDSCLSLLTPENFRFLITGHSPQVRTMDVVDYLQSQIPPRFDLSQSQFMGGLRSGRLSLRDAQNRKLDAGFFVQCTRQLSR
ncbi:class I SAM-dependent methyltransferase [Stieleria sp. TO1_6]|uniref:class I SAM-dependent methyltransferase n=1 Tax=Stieleria tagensis TaxID=2956795 RepID=UPI00209A7BE6|nr:class I SAM-dependent methyltransferase [Stieleria tagensis]MCO8120843.1 class I SAM-dependent methyltransferase [Stieleria tagensis]